MARSREADLAAKQLALYRQLEIRARICPSDRYAPHHTVASSPVDPALAAYDRIGRPSGQRQFHESTHPVRLMAPGNGWGGTSAMGMEIDAWMRHTQRWQETPPWPIVAVWFCRLHAQFDIQRESILIAKCFGKIPQWKPTGFGGPRFVWPDGGTLYIGSYDTDWTKYEGIELDLVAFDEQPPVKLWGEMMMRRRGAKKTRYICKATQTQGWSWMANDIYLPWKQYHADRGLDEEEAMVRQLHPNWWVWPTGGCHDNPALSREDRIWYEEQIWPSARERKVRLFGGFESFLGDCIFDLDAIDRLEARARDLAIEIGHADRGALVVGHPPALEPVW